MAASRTYLQTVSSGANATSYTFSAQNLGAADSDRKILVVIAARAISTASLNPSGVTVNGVTATEIISLTNSLTNCCMSSMWIADVPTGASGDVVVTLPREALRCGISLYRLLGTESTANDTGTSTAAPASASLDVPADGLAFGLSVSGATITTMAWTGITEDGEGQIGGEAAIYSVASKEFATESLATLVECEYTNNGQESLAVFAAFGPASGGGGGGLSIPVAMHHYRQLAGV